MDYVAAVIPPLVMAIAFIAVIITMIKNQGGANRGKEDAAVDAAARAERARQQGLTDAE